MVDYYFAERVFDELKQKLLIPAFRNFALTYAVPSSIVYDVLESCCEEPEESQANRKDLADKYRLRLVRLINELRISKSNDTSDNALYVSKIYDDKLNEVMVRAYRNLAQVMGDKITLMFPESTLLRNLSIEERIGFSFVEFALLLSLFLSIQGRSIGKLMEQMDTPNKVKRAIPRLRKIKDTLFSKEFERELMRLMMDLMIVYHQENYEDNLNRHLRNFWLPQSKRNLKTAKYAVDRYAGKFVCDDDYPRKEYEKLSEREKVQLVEQNHEIMQIQRLFFIIFPVTEAFIIGALPARIEDAIAKSETKEHVENGGMEISLRNYLLESNEIPIDTKAHIRNMPASNYMVSCENYLVSQKFYDVLKFYCSEVQRAVVSLLEVLPGTQFAGENGLWDYLISL